ncbi:MAG TPA: hypothetical protein VNT31_13880 [Nocardioides sp.]|nr:hypothetical protein [Nocardioides sp.]
MAGLVLVALAVWRGPTAAVVRRIVGWCGGAPRHTGLIIEHMFE